VVEIITVERRRRWSDEDKRRIVAETFEPNASVSSVAKRHGLHPGQVFSWRRAFHDDARGRRSVRGKAAFAPVVVEEPPEPLPRLPPPDGARTTGSSGRIEIILGRGRRVVVGCDVDTAALRRVLDALEPR
jgi:transposase